MTSWKFYKLLLLTNILSRSHCILKNKFDVYVHNLEQYNFLKEYFGYFSCALIEKYNKILKIQ